MNFQERINRLKGIMNGEIALSQNSEMQIDEELAQIWAFFDREKDAYYQNRVLSYSFLKHVDSVRKPKLQFGNKERNFALGRAFEDMLTDCLDVSKFPDLETSDFENLQKMCESAKRDKAMSDVLEKCERQKSFEGVLYGYKFKCKIDFMYRQSKVEAQKNEPQDFLIQLGFGFDLKSTSCTTENAFSKACVDFGYLTQGAIYCELADLQHFAIIGVSKKNHKVFHRKMTQSDFEEGKKELERLLENLAYYGIADYFKA